MDSNGFYYTLSTIAQTLAGAFAFLVAVVLYRLEAIKEGRPGLQQELDRAKNERSKRYGRENLLPQWEEKIRKCEEALQDADKMYNIIRCELDKSLKWTAIIIVMCFFTLPWINILTCKAYYMSCVGLLIVVGMAIYCVWWRYRPLVASLVE